MPLALLVHASLCGFESLGGWTLSALLLPFSLALLDNFFRLNMFFDACLGRPLFEVFFGLCVMLLVKQDAIGSWGSSGLSRFHGLSLSLLCLHLVSLPFSLVVSGNVRDPNFSFHYGWRLTAKDSGVFP